jgi:hypothetical protein
MEKMLTRLRTLLNYGKIPNGTIEPASTDKQEDGTVIKKVENNSEEEKKPENNQQQ